MTLFVLMHGSGDTGWAWHLVQRSLREFGYESAAPDLPTDRSDATWETCAEAVVESVVSHEDVVVVGHSAGGFLAPVVADRLDATLQVYVAGMVPRPGETAFEWFENVGWSEAVAAAARRDGGRTGDPDPDTAFFHDVPSSLADQAKARQRLTSEHLDRLPWPRLTTATPARYVVTERDRFIPPSLQRHVAADRLGIDSTDAVDAGHCVHLSDPTSLARLLVSMVT